MPEGGDSFDDLPYWPVAYDLECSRVVTCGDWKVTALANLKVDLLSLGTSTFYGMIGN